MDLTDWLVALHVLSAFAWIAALVLYSVVIAAGRGLSVPGDVLRVFRVVRVGDALIAVGMIGTIVFGIWLAIDEYDIWDGWIIAALALWLVAGAVGDRLGRTYNATRDRARALHAEGLNDASSELSGMLRSQRGLVLHAVLVLVTAAILVLMVWKPGA
ncbi:MAG TPA: DUF2269 family protein [Gaiellaceae bacterium]|nr:DUF2269 family protein [Gaiellaceae bacterium]